MSCHGALWTGAADQRRQGALSKVRDHQAGHLRVLRRHRRGDGATYCGPRGHPEALAQRGRGAVVLREAAGVLGAGLAAPGKHQTRIGNHHLPDCRQSGVAGLDRPAGIAGSACPAVAVCLRATGARNPGGVRPRPRRGRHDAAALRGGFGGAGADRRHRPDRLPADQREQGSASVCAAGEADQQSRCFGLGQTCCATTGTVDAETCHRDDDQEPAHRQGFPGLEPEQQRQDHHRTVFITRSGATHRCRTPHLGGDQRSGPAQRWRRAATSRYVPARRSTWRRGRRYRERSQRAVRG